MTLDDALELAATPCKRHAHLLPYSSLIAPVSGWAQPPEFCGRPGLNGQMSKDSHRGERSQEA